MVDRVTIYASLLQGLEELQDESIKGVFAVAVLRYAFEGIEPEFDDSYLRMGWQFIKPNIDNSIKFAAGGAKGGRSKKDSEEGVEDGTQPPLEDANNGGSNPPCNPPSENVSTPLDNPPSEQNKNKKEKVKDKEKGGENSFSNKKSFSPTAVRVVSVRDKPAPTLTAGTICTPEAAKQIMEALGRSSPFRGLDSSQMLGVGNG